MQVPHAKHAPVLGLDVFRKFRIDVCQEHFETHVRRIDFDSDDCVSAFVCVTAKKTGTTVGGYVVLLFHFAAG